MKTSLKRNLLCVNAVDTYIIVKTISKIYSIKLVVYSSGPRYLQAIPNSDSTHGSLAFNSILISFWAPDHVIDLGLLSSLCSVYKNTVPFRLTLTQILEVVLLRRPRGSSLIRDQVNP